MSKNVHVLQGEASESDTEPEITKTQTSGAVEGLDQFVIPGEASESDDDVCNERRNRASGSDYGVSERTGSGKRRHRSLFHQKLYESNMNLKLSLDALLREPVQSAVEKLTATDKLLLNDQEYLKSTNSCLSTSLARLEHINRLLSDTFASEPLKGVKTTSSGQC